MLTYVKSFSKFSINTSVGDFVQDVEKKSFDAMNLSVHSNSGYSLTIYWVLKMIDRTSEIKNVKI